jgi:hypothetical protein
MRQQHGLALPVVVVLSGLCSLLLLAEWRSLAWAQALGHSAALRWQLQQSALDALRVAIEDIRHNTTDSRYHMGTNTDTHAFFPRSVQEWQVLQTRLASSDCQNGICRSLGPDNPFLSPWLARLGKGQTVPAVEGQTVTYWVEILPTSTTVQSEQAFLYRITALAQSANNGPLSAWQAVWQAQPNAPASLAAPLRLNEFTRLLPLLP